MTKKISIWIEIMHDYWNNDYHILIIATVTYHQILVIVYFHDDQN